MSITQEKNVETRGSRSRSIKTRIETYLRKWCEGCVDGVREADPLKQGLKLVLGPGGDQTQTGSRSRSIKTRIETGAKTGEGFASEGFEKQIH